MGSKRVCRAVKKLKPKMNETTENLDNLSLSENNSKATSTSSLANNSAPKTPVSLLQELYVRKGITPKYDLVQIEGAVHGPTFKYRVLMGELIATGCGQSKKKAKHTAAKSMLDKLIALQQNQQSTNVPGIESSALGVIAPPKASKVVELPKDLDAELMSPHDDGINGNPVGDLQEMCMNRRLPPPVYDVGLEKGAPHERCFIIVCAVGGNLKESGSGKSKKLAKRQAAHIMLQTLKSMPVERDSEQSFAMIDEDDLAQGIARCKVSSNNKTDQVDSFFKFHRDLKTGRGPHLAGLHDLDTFDIAQQAPEEFLEKISKEQDFFVTYVDVEEKSKDDKFHCFVQLSTNPVTVCFGIGQSPQKAKMNSAANALQYLRIMTK